MSTLGKFVDRIWSVSEAPYREVLFDTSLQYQRLLRLLPLYYLWSLLATLDTYHVVRALGPPLDGPLWPLLWMNWVPWQFAGVGVLLLLVLGGLAAAFEPRNRWTRRAAFLGVFFWLAMVYSHIGIQHRTYTMLTLGLFFALMPDLPRPAQATEALRRRALLLAFGGVTFVLFTYSWAGVLKIWGIVEALIRTNDVVYDFDIVPLHLQNRAYLYRQPLLLSEFVIDHPRLSSLGFCGAVYMEVVTVAAAFRVHLHRWWFAVLTGFHFMTKFTMGVFFPPATGILILLFFFSPFSSGWLNWRAVLGELPWFGPLISAGIHKWDRHAIRNERLWMAADPSCPFSRSLIENIGGRERQGELRCEDWDGATVAQFLERFSGQFAGRGLVVESELDGERRVRFDAEAALYLALRANGLSGRALLLLTIPLPISEAIYRGIERQERTEPTPYRSPGISS